LIEHGDPGVNCPRLEAISVGNDRGEGRLDGVSISNAWGAVPMPRSVVALWSPRRVAALWSLSVGGPYAQVLQPPPLKSIGC